MVSTAHDDRVLEGGDSASFLHIKILRAEIDTLKGYLRPHDTGHIHTTINTLEWRIKILKGEEKPWM